jgi:predicted small metal-binding protein
VQRNLRQIEHSVKAHDVAFNIRFNINEVEFVTRLNEHMKDALKRSSFYQELIEVITRDYQLSKRQFAFYLLDCR